ncbi:TPA: tail fiber assembly protein [Escherichia coli]
MRSVCGGNNEQGIRQETLNECTRAEQSASVVLWEAWKKYRVLLNRVNTTTAPDIEWPTVPIIE